MTREAMAARLRREAHLWLATTDDAGRPELVARYRRLLSTGERRRLERFRVQRARREYLLGRALVRTVLSRYCPVPPRAWELTPDSRGRPEITGPAPVPALRFNLAHSYGLVACLVTSESEAGVDVEHPGRSLDTGLLARRYFSERERAEVARDPDGAGREAFFRYWTLKEAYLKALGLGIALPLRSLSFAVDQGRVDVRFEPPIDDRPDRWQFDLLRSPTGHFVATAIVRAAARPLPLVSLRCAPLATPDPGTAELERLASSVT